MFFHYGDGTMTGEGARRYEANDLREILRSRIAAANVELNKPRIVRACAKRFLFDGSDLRTDKADVLAYGDPTYFIYASKEEILAYLAVHDYSRIQTLHVGPMIISPWIRNLKRDENVEWKRSFVHIRYVNLMGDIERLNENRKRFIE